MREGAKCSKVERRSKVCNAQGSSEIALIEEQDREGDDDRDRQNKAEPQNKAECQNKTEGGDDGNRWNKAEGR